LQSTSESGARAGYDGHKRKKGKKGSKVHMAVGTLGYLLARHVTPANEQERAQVETLHTSITRWNTKNGEVGLGMFRNALEREGVRPNRLLLFSTHLMGTCRMGAIGRQRWSAPKVMSMGWADSSSLMAVSFPLL